MGGNWSSSTLADISSDVSYGYTESASIEKLGPRFLRITDIQGGVVDWAKVPYCPISNDNHRKYRLQEGDIVVARTGNSTGENYLFCGVEDAVFASYLIRFRINKALADPRFIWYNLRTANWWGFINSAKTGSAQSGANARILGQFPIGLPPLPEQRAIAHILGALDDKIELNRQMNQTLEAIARALFKSWFVDFDPVRAKAAGEQPPGLAPHIADLFPDGFVDSELGEIPKGWRVTTIGSIASISSGKRPVFRFDEPTETAAIPLWGGNGPMAYVETPLFTDPILLTGRVGTLGSVFRVTRPCWPSDNTLILQLNDSKSFEFLYFALRDIDYGSLNRGSTQPLLTQTDLNAQQCVLPNSRVIEQFHNIVSTMFARIDQINDETDILAALRDALLPKLISGELRVPDAERIVGRCV